MSKLEYFLQEVSKKNPVHYRQINKVAVNFDKQWVEKANVYLNKFEKYLNNNNKTLDYGIECYLKVVNDMVKEQYKFLKTGEYSCKNMKDAIENIYSKKDVMEYYMIGVMFSQLFWKSHYEIFRYFSENIEEILKNKKNYLEIGGGHGLFANEAIKRLKKDNDITIVDISETSLKMAKEIIDNKEVEFILSDILELKNSKKYDFITMGEVLEHVETPKVLLKKIYELLNANGIFFITVPINSPAIDHIYLFKTEEEVREILLSCGFKIKKEMITKSEEVSEELEKKYKISKVYCAFLSKVI